MTHRATKFINRQGLHGWEYRGFKIYRDSTVKPIHPCRYFVFGLGRRGKYVAFYKHLWQAKKAVDQRIEDEMSAAAARCEEAAKLIKKEAHHGKD